VPCKECPKGNGIEVFYNTPTQEYTYAPEIYGHYQLQSEMVNGRVYFKKGDHAIWWDDGNGKWRVGHVSGKGTDPCIGYFIKDVLCPHQITQWNGKLTHGKGPAAWKDAGNSLALKCSIRVPCKECPKGNGIEVFYNTPTQEYTYAPEIYGHYQLQSEMVNGRVYFKKGDHAIWWGDGNGKWRVGHVSGKGTTKCTGYFIKDVLCPHQITEWDGTLTHGKGPDAWKDAGNSLCLRS